MNPWHRLSNIDEAAKTAVCSVCGPASVHKKPSGKNYRCVVSIREGNRAWFRRAGKLCKSYWKRDWAKTKGAPDKLDTVCAICGSTNNLAGDHDHVTNEFRGTLCLTCNAGLGMFRDSKSLLTQAVTYLNK